VWVVRNKIDLDAANAGSGRGGEHVRFEISASRGDGIQPLVAGLVAFAQDYFGSGEAGMIGRERQRKLLEQTAASLQRSISAVGMGEELAAEELRIAVHSLGSLLGRVDVDDILDVIFRDFCIGK
jgi:tRNA modification GTPase